MSDNVYLTVGTSRLTGWKEVSVNKSMDTLCSSFSFSAVDRWKDAAMVLVPDVVCKIHHESEKMIEGYIDSVKIKSDTDDELINVSGRDKTGDLVDCSDNVKPNSWKNIDVQRLIYNLVKPFGIRVYMNLTGIEPVREFTISSGESVFESIQKICADRGILSLTNADGDLILTTAGSNRSVDNLVLGENVTSADVDFDFTNRFSKYIVKGQKSGGGDSWGTTTTEIFSEATDGGITRYRPKVIVGDGEMSISLAAKRAAWEAQVRAGRSGKLSLTLPTWRQSDGTLWSVNTLVACSVPPLRITPEVPLLIYEIEFKQTSEGGTICTLKLIRGDAYAAEPGKEVKNKKTQKGFGFGWW